MTRVSRRSDWKREFDIEPGIVFLNHASFGPVTRRGRLAVEDLIRRWGTLKGWAEVDDQSFRLLAESRRHFARLIDGDSRQVAFAPNTSYGLNAVLWGMDLRRGERILVPEIEFPAVVYAVQHIAELKGLKVEALPCPTDYLELDTLQRALRRGAAVLVVSWVQFFNGYRYDLKSLTQLCHEYQCFVLVDAIQGVGAVPLSARRSGIDALACGGQKWLFGQPGSGFFYIAPETVRPVTPSYAGWLGVDWGYRFEDLRHWDRASYRDGRRWEVGTYPFFALRLAWAGLSLLAEVGKRQVWANICRALGRLDSGLADSRFRLVVFPLTENRSGIAVLKGPRIRNLHQHLGQRGIQMAFREGNIRIAPHFYTTDADIDRLLEAIEDYEVSS